MKTETSAAAAPNEAAASGLSFAEFLVRANAQPVYLILGVQGSGTNLVRSILDTAFNFSVVQDQALIINAALRLGPSPTVRAVEREFRFLHARMFQSTLSRKTQRRIKSNSSFAGIHDVFDPTGIHSGAELARFVYAYSAYSRRTLRMAIKSDDIWETIRHIDTVLPRRRVLLLTRDFRDNLLSVSNKDFGPVEPIVAARYVKERFAYYHEEYSRTEPAHRLHVRYEDILESPDRFVSDFGAHFGLTHEDEDRAGPIEPGRIRRDNVRKWTRLSPTELAQCEAILREEMLTYGYSPEREAVPPPEGAAWALARARDAARRVPQKLRSIAKRLSR